MHEAPDAIALMGDRCCGCGACSAACPKACISMESDLWGFRRPKVDTLPCTDCGLCVSACPALSAGESDIALSVSWARSKNKDELAQSSSGGIFGLLASACFSSDGIVVGAAWDNDFHSVSHVIANDPSDLDALMRSKYVQSSVGSRVYRVVRSALREGKRVLFSGTACQVAGLRGYLGKLADSELLLAVDVICHGVPAPALWERWAAYREKVAGAKLVGMNMRSKTTGWLSYSASYEYGEEKDGRSRTDSTIFRDDWYFKTFLSNACLRQSCFSCPSKRRCGSDLTLGDFWGVQSAHPEVDYTGGISAVICNTEKGEAAFKAISDSLELGSSTFEKVLAGNPSLAASVAPYARYDEFMADLAAGKKISELMDAYAFKLSFLQRVRSRFGAVKRKLVK